MKLDDRQLPLDKLLLDPNNYRLDYDGEASKFEDDEVLKQQEQTQRRLENERLGELRDSILQNGFLEMDRIVVRQLKTECDPPLYVIVEGNRRAAAFKGLIEDYRSGTELLPQELIDKSESIGVICVEGSDEEISDFSATLMGIRHVSGPKKWAGYQSARLINDLVERGKSFTEVGALLGISHFEAARRMRGYRAFVQLSEDQEYSEKSSLKHYALLLEFLSPVGKDWLGWKDDEYKFTNNNVKRLYSAIVGDDGKSEVSNPSEAREFVKALKSDLLRSELERGVLLCDLPDLSVSNDGVRSKLEKILIMVSSVNAQDLSAYNLELVGKIVSISQGILDKMGADNG